MQGVGVGSRHKLNPCTGYQAQRISPQKPLTQYKMSHMANRSGRLWGLRIDGRGSDFSLVPKCKCQVLLRQQMAPQHNFTSKAPASSREGKRAEGVHGGGTRSLKPVLQIMKEKEGAVFFLFFPGTVEC